MDEHDDSADRERKRKEAERAMWDTFEALRQHPKPKPLPAPVTKPITAADKRRDNATKEARTRAEKVNQWQRAEPTRE